MKRIVLALVIFVYLVSTATAHRYGIHYRYNLNQDIRDRNRAYNEGRGNIYIAPPYRHHRMPYYAPRVYQIPNFHLEIRPYGMPYYGPPTYQIPHLDLRIR